MNSIFLGSMISSLLAPCQVPLSMIISTLHYIYLALKRKISKWLVLYTKKLQMDETDSDSRRCSLAVDGPLLKITSSIIWATTICYEWKVRMSAIHEGRVIVIFEMNPSHLNFNRQLWFKKWPIHCQISDGEIQPPNRH